MLKKLLIQHRCYKIVPMSMVDAAATGNQGIARHRKCIIEIDMSDNDRELADTLLHEIIHSIICCLAIRPGDVDEEIFVTALSSSLIATFINNPKLLEEFQELLGG